MRDAQQARAQAKPVMIAGERFFERVHFLRGMEDAMIDMANGAPEMDDIVELILQYNLAYLQQALQLDLSMWSALAMTGAARQDA